MRLLLLTSSTSMRAAEPVSFQRCRPPRFSGDYRKGEMSVFLQNSRVRKAITPCLVIILELILFTMLVTVLKGIEAYRYDVSVLSYPFQVDDAEGVILAEASIISHGMNPYMYQPSPAHYFYAGPYTPVYTLVNSVPFFLSHPTFKLGRLMQLLATLFVGIWLCWTVGRGGNTGDWLVGGWVAILFISLHLVTLWSVILRPDMTALSFNLIGIMMLNAPGDIPESLPWSGDSWPRGQARGIVFIGAVCFALGWWTKQTFVAAPAAFLLTLFPRRPKMAVTLAGLWGGLVIGPGAVLTIVTHGGFVQKVIAYQGSWEWNAYRRLAQPFIERYWVILAFSFFAVFYQYIQKRIFTFGGIWFIISSLFTLGAGTSGGSSNHFIEALAAGSLCIGEAIIGALHSARDGSTRKHWFLVACISFALLLITGTALFERENPDSWLARQYRQPTQLQRDGFSMVSSYLANTQGFVYSDNVGLLVVSNKSVLITDPFTMAAETRLGRWDDTAFVEDVIMGRYAAIALRYDVSKVDPRSPPTDATPAFIEAVRKHYRLIEKNVQYIYTPVHDHP